ncbi:MAG: ABC transporter ATP-binding protein [Candidatus Puniceispirillaceae bacterium]
MLLEMRDIHKSYDELQVLRGVSLAAKKGDIISLIGSSGSGKSTLLRCANLLELSQSGDIIFEGEPVRWSATSQDRKPADKDQIMKMRTQLSMVFQQFNLWSHMTILQNVIEAPCTVLGRDKAEMTDQAMALLDKVGIADKANVYPAQMSGGQQQRAAIARALAMEPKALLLDEPTSALDPELEQEVVKVIRQLADEGRTMLLVTHDMKLARDVSSHVVFLHEGRIEEEGVPTRIFANPASDRLKQFLSASL